ncbi:MAG TPA: glycosyltransferase, partial [Solirubrobacteraceae bacterium]|nr:glycosyltransferase [Solirubrobacteraceae bacterium]
MASLTVDVALVAYRRWDLTHSCLEHLARQTREHRVYLCDNGCDEGTSERARTEFPSVEVRRLEHNMPYAVACNTAAAMGGGDVIVMMNNDVDARPDFVERLVAPLERDPQVGSVAPLLVRPGEGAIDSVG